MRGWIAIVAVGVLGCGKKVETAAPIGGPAAVAAAFMRAVTDSNLTQMAELWGSARGSAVATGAPNDWQRRVVVMQLYLRGGAARVHDAGLPGTPDRRELMVELTRAGCTRQVPFTMVRTKDGAWLVNAVDLNAAGNPAKPCDRPAPPSQEAWEPGRAADG